MNQRIWSSRGRVSALGLGILAAAVLLACSADTLLADKESAAGGESAILAKIGDEVITRAEIEESVAAELKQLDVQRHQILERGLENTINQRLLEIEAKSRDLSTDELLAAEIDDAEVDAVYEAQKARIQASRDEVAPSIRSYLANRDLLPTLREKYEVVSLMEPLRFPVDAGDSPSKGPADAPITIVEYSDFQCPFCSRVLPSLEKVHENYGDKVRVAFRQFPLRSIHPQAQKAAEASLCANDQGKFWEMHDAMFADQQGLAIDKLKEKAAALELDGEAFAECLDSGRYADTVEADLRSGSAAGVSGTPALFINGRMLSGAQPYEAFAKIIDDELARLEG